MQNNKYIEIRTRQSFGDIINLYFLFLKQNFKHFVGLYLRYNTVSIILSLTSAYLLATGFMGLASRDFRFGMNADNDNESYIWIGLAILILMIFIAFLINNSFSSAYLADYLETKGQPTSAGIWKRLKKHFGNILVLMLIGLLIYMAYIVIAIILAFIPLLGMFAQYGIGFIMSALFGLSFMSIFARNKNGADAFGEAWSFTFSSFFKCILYGLVIGFLNLLIILLILSIPSFILGIYIFFSIESEIDILSNSFSYVIFTFSFAIYIIAYIFSISISQLAYGLLYYNLHEEKYNTYLRENIEKIGVNA